MSDVSFEPTNDQVQQLTRMAQDLPPGDFVRDLYVIQDAAPNTPAAALLRRAIAEILSLRAEVRRMRNS
jgi:hypothetical protein